MDLYMYVLIIFLVLLKTYLRKKKNEWKTIYLFCLAKLTPVKSLKGESAPIQQVNYVSLENVFDTLIGIQPLMSFIFFY